jgi:hypothetical protein
MIFKKLEILTIRPSTDQAGEVTRIEPSRLQKIIRILPTRSSATRVKPSRRISVRRPQRGAWDDRGWHKQSERGTEVYVGFYCAREKKTGRRLQFPGRITVSRWQIAPYIANPPDQVRRHPKWACFSSLGDGWFRIHWYRSAKNVDDAILYIERILDESINKR